MSYVIEIGDDMPKEFLKLEEMVAYLNGQLSQWNNFRPDETISITINNLENEGSLGINVQETIDTGDKLS